MYDLCIEYNRLRTVHKIRKILTEGLEKRQKYKVSNSLERWLIMCAEDPDMEDFLFSTAKIDTNNYNYQKMKAEIAKKGIEDHEERLSKVREVIEIFLRNPKGWIKDVRYYVDFNTLHIERFRKNFPPARLGLLLTLASLEEIVVMVLRYCCLLPRGQQWSVPTNIYRFFIEKYGVTIEGFASPINSQIIAIDRNLHFCSIFYDVDRPFGSLGSFFDQDFNNKRVIINPPYIEPLLQNLALFLEINLQKYESFLGIVYSPRWDDAGYYRKLQELSSQVILLERGKHHYIDTNNNEVKVQTCFNSTIFVIAKGIAIDNNLEKHLYDIYNP